jgi:predicted hydrocarbon binding protein
MAPKKEVWIFYSSETEPELPVVYAAGITYLHESDIKTHVIDVHQHPDVAEKFKILATPAIITKRGRTIHRFLGIVDGLHKLLSIDLGGKSVLHLLGFKDGRALAGRLRIPKQKKNIEEALKPLLAARGILHFKIIAFNASEHSIEVSLTSELPKQAGKRNALVCTPIAALLGGIFTELLNYGVTFKEKTCLSQGNSACVFETIPEIIRSGV